MIFAREFIEEDKDQLYDMISEINEYDGNFEGLDNVGRIKDYSQFLRELEISKDQALIHPDFSPQTTFGVFVDGKLVGGFNLRHVLKGVLINHGGNLGYLIRPSERKKGLWEAVVKACTGKNKRAGNE